jgi:hypothetical protein
VLDACALYPMSIRDTLLRAAAAGLYQLYWSARILDEMESALVRNGHDATKTARTRGCMSSAFPEAEVSGYESLIGSMPNQEKDRHVAAAAVKAGAELIVTSNLADFADLPDGIEVQSPDEFLTHLFELNRDGMVDLLRRQAADKKSPPITFEELVTRMSSIAPEFAGAVILHVAELETDDG